MSPSYSHYNSLKNITLEDVSSLDYLCFETSRPNEYTAECNSAYLLWEKQWRQTFDDLGVEKKLLSDDFQNRILCGLFRNGTAIGFILYQNVNLKLFSACDSLYFSNYSESLKKYQQSTQDQVFIISYMTLNPDWRKTNTNYSISELLISFVVLEFNFSNADRIIGYFRNNRSTNQIFYRHAGKFLSQETAYNVQVDFAEIHKDDSQISDLKDHAVISLKLWQNFHNNQKQKENINGTKNSYRTQRDERPRRNFSELGLD
jgi:hypothetical protein